VGKLMTFLWRCSKRQRCTFLPGLFNTVLEVLAWAIRQEKEIKSTQVGKEENYLIYRGNDHIGRKPKIFHQKAVRTNKWIQ
jgi:hypothetical protein